MKFQDRAYIPLCFCSGEKTEEQASGGRPGENRGAVEV